MATFVEITEDNWKDEVPKLRERNEQLIRRLNEANDETYKVSLKLNDLEERVNELQKDKDLFREMVEHLLEDV